MNKQMWATIGIFIALALFPNPSKGTEEEETNNVSLFDDYLNAIQDRFGNLSDEQYQGLQMIIEAFQIYGDSDYRKLSYIIATAYHESRMKPIKEIRATQGTSLYDQQNQYWFTGYYGRGFVQLTHKSNYESMSDFLGVDMVSNPDLALNPYYAAQIIVYGMMNGSFTGRRLSQYIDGSFVDFYNARRIVNGLDKADLIKSYALGIESRLTINSFA